MHQLHNPVYGEDNNNDEQLLRRQTNGILHEPRPAAITEGVSNHHHGSLGEEKENGDHVENVYHILENPGGDDNDTYEELDKYEKQEQNNQEENVYHILDGPTVVEEEPGGVATSTDSIPEEHKVPILSTDASFS